MNYEDCEKEDEFIIHIAKEFQRYSNGHMSWENCINDAKDIYDTFCLDEQIRFGDPAYDWSEIGAIELAHCFSIDYWS